MYAIWLVQEVRNQWEQNALELSTVLKPIYSCHMVVIWLYDDMKKAKGIQTLIDQSIFQPTNQPSVSWLVGESVSQ